VDESDTEQEEGVEVGVGRGSKKDTREGKRRGEMCGSEEKVELI